MEVFPGHHVTIKETPRKIKSLLKERTPRCDVPFRLPSAPVVVAPAGNLCDLLSTTPPPDISLLDKDFLSYDPASRTLAVSYTRFFLTGIHSGLGQIEVARAHIPATPTALSAASFGTPITVWPEEQFCPAGTPSSERTQCGADNQGACPAVAPGGDIYVAFGWLRIA